jgi:hypothetical protein
MNKGIRYEDIRDRLAHHSTENMEAFDFEAVFPEVAYHARTHTDLAIHVGDWFHISPHFIRQVSAYGNDPKCIYLLIEPILEFEVQKTQSPLP